MPEHKCMSICDKCKGALGLIAQQYSERHLVSRDANIVGRKINIWVLPG